MSRGRVVLCGSGEFTPAMDGVDREILDGIGKRAPRVAIVPTAAGLEDTPHAWVGMGTDHFRALGAEPVGVLVLGRADAEDAAWCDAIAGADWIYFSGGQPGHLVETLAGSRFWHAVLARLGDGAVLAGASAGAMMLGGRTFDPRGRDADGLPTSMGIRDGLGLLPGVIVAPHFDAIPEERWRRWAALRIDGDRVLGIDEDTALVEQHAGWSVRGRGRVAVVGRGGAAAVHASGARLDGLIRVTLP